MQRFPDADPYEVLELDHRCSSAEVKAAYKKHALKCHPDRAPPEQKEAATARFKIIAEAYDTLSDERKRRDYDMFSPRDRGGAGPSFGPSAFDAAAVEFASADRQHFGTSPDGRSFSFTWESAADSARRAQRSRAGRPFGPEGYDPFELFNMMFENEFGSGGNGARGMEGAESPFGGFMGGDPFMQNHRRMADFRGFGFGAPPAAPRQTAAAAGDPFGMPFGAGIPGAMPGMGGGGFGGISSMLSSFGSGGGMDVGGSGFSSSSESQSTRVVNGRQETTIRRVDAQGNETVHHITPEGQTVHVNGVAQPDHPLLGGSSSKASASVGPCQSRAPLPGTFEAPIDVDAL